jgi:integrase
MSLLCSYVSMHTQFTLYLVARFSTALCPLRIIGIGRVGRSGRVKGANKRDRVITAKEELAYLRKAKTKSPLLTDFASVLFDTALRPEECHRLRWEGIVWEGGLHGDSTLQVTHGKTDSARREVPMSPRVQEILRARWRVAGRPLEGWVWPNTETASGHVEPSTLKKIHAKVCKDAFIKPFVLLCGTAYVLDSLGLFGLRCLDTCPNSRTFQNPNVNDVRSLAILMEGAGWWGKWWESRKKPKSATS